VCFDEWGPLELRPIGGVTWARPGRPARMRATYRRPHGTEQFLGFYDVHADCLNGVFRRRKRVAEVSEAFRRLRACYPRTRLFVIMDNLRNVHDHPRFRAVLRRLRIRPVFTPTEASWLNLIEAQFGVLKRFTLANTDDASHRMRRQRIYRYLRYRHRTLGRLRHPLHRIRSVRPIKLDGH
jgi:transposase